MYPTVKSALISIYLSLQIKDIQFRNWLMVCSLKTHISSFKNIVLFAYGNWVINKVIQSKESIILYI